MIRRLLITLCLSCSFTLAAAQGGDKIGIGDFRAIDTRGNVELIIVQSDSTSRLEVSYHNVKQTDFRYQVRKGVLYIDLPSGLLDAQGFVRLTVHTPHLERIKSCGASIECQTPIKGEYFEFTTDGSINMARLNVEVDRLTIKTSGHSDVMVVGSATQANLSAKFGSRIDAFYLAAQTATAAAYDQSEIYVSTKESLKAQATTGATIYYTATAKVEPKVSLFADIVLVERLKYKPLFDNDLSTPTQTVQPTDRKAESKEVDQSKETKEVDKRKEPAKAPTEEPAEPATTRRKVEKKANAKKAPAEKPGAEPAAQPTTDGDFF